MLSFNKFIEKLLIFFAHLPIFASLDIASLVRDKANTGGESGDNGKVGVELARLWQQVVSRLAIFFKNRLFLQGEASVIHDKIFKIRQNCNNIIVIGVGGSMLVPRLIAELAARNNFKQLHEEVKRAVEDKLDYKLLENSYFCDNLSEEYLNYVMAKTARDGWDKLVIFVVSKSGISEEVLAIYNYIKKILLSQLEVNILANNCYFVTDLELGPQKNLLLAEAATLPSINLLAYPDFLCGRFSFFNEFIGLIAGLWHFDFAQFCEGVADFIASCNYLPEFILQSNDYFSVSWSANLRIMEGSLTSRHGREKMPAEKSDNVVRQSNLRHNATIDRLYSYCVMISSLNSRSGVFFNSFDLENLPSLPLWYDMVFSETLGKGFGLIGVSGMATLDYHGRFQTHLGKLKSNNKAYGNEEIVRIISSVNSYFVADEMLDILEEDLCKMNMQDKSSAQTMPGKSYEVNGRNDFNRSHEAARQVANDSNFLEVARLQKLFKAAAALQKAEVPNMIFFTQTLTTPAQWGFFLANLMAEVIVFAVMQDIAPFEQKAIEMLKKSENHVFFQFLKDSRLLYE